MSEAIELTWREDGALNGAIHKIDFSGNYFIGRKCVNPKKNEGEIGSNYPSSKEIEKLQNIEKENRKV